MEISRRHLRLIGLYSARHAVRGGAGLVFLLLGLLFSLFVANAVVTPVEQLLRQQGAGAGGADARAVLDQLMTVGRPVVEWALGGGSSGWADYLLLDRPALLSAIFLILVFGLPFLVPLGAFNQTAGDVGNRGIRYLLLRTERANIFVGRFLATALFAMIVFAVSVATITLYIGLKLHIYSAGELIPWCLYGIGALAVLSLPYVALCAAISASMDSAMLSLVACTMVIGGVLLVAFIGSRSWEPLAYAKWLLPWGVQNYLFSPAPGRVILAVLACLLYTSIYLYLGNRRFGRRDL